MHKLHKTRVAHNGDEMEQQISITPDRVISAKERRQMIPYSDMHIWRLEKAGIFPRRIRLGAGRVGWSLRELVDWIEKKKELRDAGRR